MSDPRAPGETGGHAASSRGRPPFLVLIPLLLVVVAIGASLVLLNPNPPIDALPTGRPAAFPPPMSPIIVNVRRSGDGPVAIGFPVRVSASALGRTGIAALELWSGGQRVEIVETVDHARPAASARWEWVPESVGETILVARAFDAAGRTAQSAPLRVTVVEEPVRGYRLLEVTTGKGETLEALVARVGGDLSLARSLNDDLPEGTLPTGALVAVPRFDPVEPPLGAAGPRLLDDAALAAAVDGIAPVGLAIPDVDVSVDADCVVTATASNGGADAAGYAFAALPPVGDAFLAMPPVAPSSDGSATMSFGAFAGMNYLTVASYTGEASATSSIVPFIVPPDCGPSGWEGTAKLEGGKLIVGATADRVYVYLRIGEGAWQRLPAKAGSFVEPVGGVFDFGPLLPPLALENLALEAWGWQDGVLTKLGAGSYTATAFSYYAGSGGLQLIGDLQLGLGTSLDIVLQKEGGEFFEKLTKHSEIDLPGPNSTSSKRTFKWATSVPGVTHLVWQILPYPLGESSTNLTPPFLIDSGTIEVGGLVQGFFELDLKPYLLGSSPSAVWSSTLLGEQLIGEVIQANPWVPSPTAAPGGNVIVAPGNLWLPQPSSGTTTGAPPSVSVATLQDLAFLIPPPSTLFVRVIPFAGPTAIPAASNPVSFDVVEPGEPIYIDTSPPPPPPNYDGAFTMVADFLEPTGSNFKFARCVKVVKGGKVLPNTTSNWKYLVYTGGLDWSNGTVHCVPPPDDDNGWSLSDAFESFADWVGDVWDYVSDGYTWLQDKVVEAVLFVVPCEKIANNVADNGKEVCRKIAKTALQAALASFGIPPEIPDWDSTIAAVKGDLRTFILENAKTLPGVGEACDAAILAKQADSSFPTCEALVDKAIDSAVEQVLQERSAAASANTGVLVPSGVIVQPDPRGMAQPPHFEITLTRTGMPLPPDVTCTMHARMTSQFGDGVNEWDWLEYEWTGGNPKVVKKGPQVVTGEPFVSTKQSIPLLAPGQSITFEMWLTKRSIWFEPDGWNDYYAEQYAEWNGSNNHAWVLLQPGATVKGELTSNCVPDGHEIVVLTGQAWN